MDESTNRRQFLQKMTALGAAGGVSVALAAEGAGSQQSLAQAQPAVPGSLAADTARGLPRIQLMIGNPPERGQGPDGFAALQVERQSAAHRRTDA
jgi:hypothetical protein